MAYMLSFQYESFQVFHSKMVARVGVKNRFDFPWYCYRRQLAGTLCQLDKRSSCPISRLSRIYQLRLVEAVKLSPVTLFEFLA